MILAEKRSERGSETVQFVVAAPLLLVILFSVMQVGGMMLAASQISSEVTRASRQLDVAGFERAVDKGAFVKGEVLGAVTQLKPDNLRIDNVAWQTKQERSRSPHGGGSLEQSTTVTAVSYDVSYSLPVIAELPGLKDRAIARHVDCMLVGGRVIEVELGSA